MENLFSARLKSLRKDKKMTAQELSEALDVPRATITAWEIKRSYPLVDRLVQIADYFNVSLDYLLGRKDKKR